MRRRNISMVCLILISISLFSTANFIEGVNGDERVFSGGSGTVNDPYLIGDIYDLQDMKDHLSSHFILINDIDASETLTWNSGDGFIPIGRDNTVGFDGSLDGKNFTISSLSINRTGSQFIGLFGYIASSGKVSNLGLVEAVINGRRLVGCIAGDNEGSLFNVNVTGMVNGNKYVGGLAGSNGGTINKSYAMGNIQGTESVGGLCGSNYGLITRSFSSGNVSGSKYVGGLLGDCSSEVTYCYSNSNVSGSDTTGGLVGLISRGSFKKCYATGNVISSGEINGGFGGYMSIGTIKNCYSRGNIVGTRFIGGFIGWNWAEGSITMVYSIGKVEGNGFVGGLVGANEGSVTASFWDNQTSEIRKSAAGIGRYTEMMKNSSTFIDRGWDFDNTWCIVENATYPVFEWQDNTPPIADAGPDQIVYEGSLVLFDGSKSQDDTELGYKWTFNDGIEDVIIYGLKPNHTFNIIGDYIINLTVMDPKGNTDSDIMNLKVIADEEPPIADAGPDQTVVEGTMVFLDGRNSTDNVAIDQFLWSFNNGSEEIILFGISTSYNFSEPGVYIVTLNVSDRTGLWNTDIVKITVIDITSPIADAGSDLYLDEDKAFHFNGSNSWDNVGIVNYTWTFEDNGIQHLYGINPRYCFREPGIYNVTLNVSDNEGYWSMDNLTVTVWDITYPFADAGNDIIINEGSFVSFNGTGSFDNVGIVKYTWTFVDGNPIVLYGSQADYRFSNPGKYVVTLTIRDGSGNMDTDTITVIVKDITPPDADAGPDQTINEGTMMTFNGSFSTDNVNIINYTWTFEYVDQDVVLFGISPSFVFYMPGIYSIILRVTDASGKWAEDNMTVYVQDITSPVANAGRDLTVPVETDVQLNGSLSSDNVVIIDYIWTFYYNGELKILEGEKASFTFDIGGSYEIILKVTDDFNNTDEDSMTLKVIDTGKVGGIVNDENGQPVISAYIEITTSDGKLHTTETGANGSFFISIPHGYFTWVISKEGYKTISGNSSVKAMNETHMDFILESIPKETSERSVAKIYVSMIISIIVILGIVLIFIMKNRKNRDKPVNENGPSLSDEDISSEL